VRFRQGIIETGAFFEIDPIHRGLAKQGPRCLAAFGAHGINFKYHPGRSADGQSDVTLSFSHA